MKRAGKLHALLATARVANIPSVASNVWVGIVVGSVASQTPIPLNVTTGLMLAGILLYVSGNFLNDWHDRSWDMRHRPERALPRAIFRPGFYLVVTILLQVTGIVLATAIDRASGIVAAMIVFGIIIYTLIHKRTAWGVIPMGLCRTLLPIMGCVVSFPFIDKIWPSACALLFYIMGLSLSARYESMATPPKRIGFMSRGLLLATAIFAAWGAKLLWAERDLILLGTLPYLLWGSLCLRIWRQPVPLLVSRLLAGIPLVDWMVLLPFGLFSLGRPPELVAMGCLILPPLAFLLALALQRVAPAT